MLMLVALQVQGSELSAVHFPSPVFMNVERMANDGNSEFVVDPSLYYPVATLYFEQPHSAGLYLSIGYTFFLVVL